ncbi:FYDLN acid domain-containing protein [Pararhodospirillum photometricum]|uniref:Uncharacterized protein conserved in bacteria n=1 Tax=Pararhodospirillum photometricum DSM 122 TaxID=1150469 RepID=H6SLF5_PARPM|nr:FYDLN acid domain-containing protein [Pararhodospirillum photometricum]CCG08820.1 Uncharacterized protein conserved in bacteria [Pararhodospirillum photometricum DSM 122]
MSKPEWGVKRTCTSCGARFYDLRRSPAVCPKCEAVLELDSPVKLRRAERKKEPPKVVPVVPLDEEDVDLGAGMDVDDALEADDDDEVADLMEDTSDLGEDDTDLHEVKDHLELDESE